MVNVETEEYGFQSDFRLYPKHMKDMELDDSIVECIPDSSSKLNHVIGHDFLLLSAIKNNIKKKSVEAA